MVGIHRLRSLQRIHAFRYSNNSMCAYVYVMIHRGQRVNAMFRME